MGAEALLRRAEFVLGIERSPQVCEVIRRNWQALNLDQATWQVLAGTLPHALQQIGSVPFDLIYLDPPYDSDLYEPVLSALIAQGLLAQDGELALEHRPQRAIALPAALELRRQKRYGSTVVSLVGYKQQTDSP
jgi:16S rRNA (guanine966-N2)-methyltransferase